MLIADCEIILSENIVVDIAGERTVQCCIKDSTKHEQYFTGGWSMRSPVAGGSEKGQN
jgi:hypothetical protein